MSEEILNINEVCELLGIHRRTMYSLVKEGKIPAIKIGGQWRFSKKAIIDLFFSPSENDRIKIK